MQPDEFFEREYKSRYQSFRDQKLKDALNSLVQAFQSYLHQITNLEEAAEQYYSPGVDEAQPIGRGSGSGGAPGSRLDGLDRMLRYSVMADIRDVERLIDGKSRAIVKVLRGGSDQPDTGGKVSTVERAQIAHRLRNGDSATALAREYGISRSRVYQIGRRENG